MLQAERREAEPTGKGKKPAGESVRIEKERLESYSNLLFEMISKLGFLLPEAKYEDDPLRRSYQPSLSYRGCLLDIQKFISKVYDENLDMFDCLRCRIGEWKFMMTHFLPLLMCLTHASPSAHDDLLRLLQIINMIVACEDDEEAVKSAYAKDLKHHGSIYKKLFSHTRVMGALTTLLASTLSGQENLKYPLILQVTLLLRTLLSSADAASSSDSLTQNLAYGRRESMLAAMQKCRLIDVVFCLTSSIGNPDVLSWTNYETAKIFEHLLALLSSLFRDVSAADLVESKKAVMEAEPSSKPRKPIRHGRFSGSVSVQLSTGESIIINNAAHFAAGMPGSLDFAARRNKKLESKMSGVSRKKRMLSSDERSMLLKLSLDYLDSHFNKLFDFVCSKDIVLRHKDQYLRHLMDISAYFMEFCREYRDADKAALPQTNSDTAPRSDRYASIYGMISKKYMLEAIDYLNQLVSEKHYPSMLGSLRFFQETLLLLEQFSKSPVDERRIVSENLQKELFHKKNTLLLIKRVICISKPLTNFFMQACIDCNHILFRLVEEYARSHEYWFVSAGTFLETLMRENPDDDDSFRNYSSDTNFSYAELVKQYSSRDVVDFYALALSNCFFVSSDMNRKVARYFYRVLKTGGCSKTLMRASMIVQLQKVLTAPENWHQRNADLLTVGRLMVRQFSAMVRESPLFIIQSFFN